jgi:hypothetical protein
VQRPLLLGEAAHRRRAERVPKQGLISSEKLADVYKSEKRAKKLAKKACKVARRMVLYLSAKRRDKRMTSESRLEVKRKEPIDVRKFRQVPRNRERSKFAGEIRITKNFEKRA